MCKNSCEDYICHVHAKKDHDWGVKVAPSNIKNAGNGLFATRNFKKGDMIAPYPGKIITIDECADKNSFYAIRLFKNFVWDASHLEKHLLGDTCNDCLPIDVEKGYGTGTNAHYCYQKSHKNTIRCFLSASRPITCGEEIFATYGDSFWSCKSNSSQKETRKRKRQRK